MFIIIHLKSFKTLHIFIGNTLHFNATHSMSHFVYLKFSLKNNIKLI